jgi:periplasmic divalent cation tolerance protein
VPDIASNARQVILKANRAGRRTVQTGRRAYSSEGSRLPAMAQYLQVSTATPSRDEAVRLAGSSVEAGLAAGAQVVGPVVSVFWHEGQYGEGEEWQVLLKTTEARYAELEAHLLKQHPWDNPEVAAVPLVAGSAGYFEWLDRTTAKP